MREGARHAEGLPEAAAVAVGGRIGALAERLSRGLVGRTPLVQRLLIGLLSGGHLLVEGAPGLAKTRAVKLLSQGIDASFSRIQCTPDLMPADLTGTPVFRPDRGSFEFVRGPVFHSLVLVDEINRAPPKVQSALLEAMAEGQVTAGGTTYPLPDPFMVVATQNPIEQEGTFPLPEAQLDRFLLHVVLELPDAVEEREILDLVERETIDPALPQSDRLDLAALREARTAALQVHLAPALKDYIVRLVTATRDPSIAPELQAAVEHPVSPRGTLALAAAAKVRAYLAGRDYALPEDVAELATDALAHRLVLTWRAAADGETPRRLIDRLCDRVQPL
ncbi:MoxR-like ATPase [Tistlia consotensis]|uniref:MoxR-like ATPase n=1 Tax=Tistlia consotensis USBA 355 TaxID=560819 RepID=A0A1Y6CED1_9PROT|nr:AAA family ATPase [Tistlia consotensis]SMF51809.1 MoxR-like ATPase [Tistlia consotensis USBA 355]SNR83746.1 MoxR-like ATPase [Tistlia consotensis]